ncbi:YigZ family protein [Fumia xinanensis]|uniref:YigZ family protein n=1 Tax=Fumia xinanensis TaxID=2763659 RepID=A0A926E201_9FIRM|nr:YigZ family protein [Fumia xinanensis]MBC8560164.1 YigZ family protein [Fumia xinanensis]
MKDYLTIEGFAEDEFVEKKSRFIGYAKHVETEEEAVSFINELKQKHWDATHNVYAYVLRDGQIRRYSDDGEPQGTAGIPTLDVILKEGVVDVCVVVTRYFGGILLGGGGLVRAYSLGCRAALKAAKKLHMAPCTVLETAVDYGFYGKLSYILPKYNIATLDSDFGADVVLKLMIKSERLPGFLKELTELSGGTVTPEVLEEKYADME